MSLALARTTERDPQALKRATALLVAIVVLWPMLVLAEFKPATCV